MLKALLYVDEDLPSSIALRFAAQQAKLTAMQLQIIHVEEPDPKKQAGTGWVRRSWEKTLEETGREEVRRLLKTEKIDFSLAGSHKVMVGSRDDEVQEECRYGCYDLYIEGYLNTANVNDFYKFLQARRFQDVTAPVLLAKNLVPVERILLLVSEAVDSEQVVSTLKKLYGDCRENIDLSVLYYRFKENSEIAVLEKKESGSYLERMEGQLAEAGFGENDYLVLEGTPEQAATYLRDHGLVVTSFPTRKSPRQELLALLSNPVLLCR